MRQTARQTMREARQLFRLCLVNGTMDEDRVRRVVRAIRSSGQRGSLTLLGCFQRWVRLDRVQHTAKVESAEPVPEDLRATVQAGLSRLYGDGLTMQFAVNPALIGGMRVQVGSDVFDKSVQAGISELKKRFGIGSANGSDSQV